MVTVTISVLVSIAAAGAQVAQLPRVDVRAASPGADAFAAELRGVAPQLVLHAAAELDLPAPPAVSIVVAPVAPRSAEEARALGLDAAPYWAAGLAEPWRARIVLFADRLDVAGHESLRGVLVHEAVHLVLGTNVPPGADVPRWYDEGLAMVVERELSLADAMRLAELVAFRNGPELAKLARAWPATADASRDAYAAALSFMDHARRGTKPGAPRRLVEALRAGASFDRAFTIAYGAAWPDLERDWRATLRERYVLLPILWAGTLANVGFGALAFIAAVSALRRRRRALAEAAEDEAWDEPGHDEWRDPPDA